MKMKKSLVATLVLLWLTSLASAHSTIVFRHRAAAPPTCNAPNTFDLWTDFENSVESCTTCVEDGATWTKTRLVGSGAYIDYDATSSPAIGSQFMRVYSGTDNVAFSSVPFSASSEGSIFFLFRTAAAPPTSAVSILRSWSTDPAVNTGIKLLQHTSGYLRIYHGGVNQLASTTALLANTWYYIWFDYDVSTGSDGRISLYVKQADGSLVRPATAETTITTGTDTDSVGGFDFCAGEGGSGTTATNDFDRVIWSNTFGGVDDVCAN